jgi:aspartate/methionine/tyrosine aminotransferase
MKLPPFLLDQWLAAHEFADPPIRYNLASSTGPGWTLDEVLALGDEDARREIAQLRLSYAPPQGGAPLRQHIAALHGVSPDEVIVLTGASEALLTLTHHFAPERGEAASIVLPRPCYPAVPVMARGWGLSVRHYTLDAARGFAQTADQVMAAVDRTTRAVFVNSPHNPTGSVMHAEEQHKLSAMLMDRGIALIVDEVYHPLYFSTETPSAARSPGSIVIGDFAKALSLPGLRIGWLIDRDARRREAIIDARSYFSISNSPLTEAIGALALAHAGQVLERLRSTANANLGLLKEFMAEHHEQLDFTAPAGGTTCFPRLRDGRDARPLCEALARDGVLVAPGDCFEAPAHMRIGFGALREGYSQALEIFAGVLRRA